MTEIPNDLITRDDIIIDGTCVANYWISAFEQFYEGGFNAQIVSLLGVGDIRDGIDAYRAMNRFIRDNPKKIQKVSSINDIINAKKNDKIAVIYHMQGAENLGTDPDNLEIHYQLGLRVLQLAYNRRNAWCEGCNEFSQEVGLSKLGIHLIDECNRLGVIVDGSHTSWRSVIDACEISSSPVICSHSNPYEVYNSNRNISDEVICAIADTEGVIGINAFPTSVSSKRPITSDIFIKHFTYVSDLVGPEYISIGLDYYFRNFGLDIYQNMIKMGYWTEELYPEIPPWTWPQGIDDITRAIPNLALSLYKNGFSRREIRGILGGNLFRVFRQAWKN